MPEPQDIAALRDDLRDVIESNATWAVDPVSSQVDAVMDVLASLLSEVERGRALRAAVEALAEEWAALMERCDNSAAKAELRACRRDLNNLLAAHVPSPLLDGGAGEGDR